MFRLFSVLLLVLFAASALAAPVPKSLKKKPLRAKIEPRLGEAVYTVVIQDAPFGKAAEALERETGLMFISKDRPDLKITLHAEQVCLAELFAQLDDILYPHGWVLARKQQSFCTLSVKDLARYTAHIPLIEHDELDRRSLYSPVRVVVRVSEEHVEAGIALAKEINEVGFEWSTNGTDKLFVGGLAKDVRKLVDDLGDHVQK